MPPLAEALDAPRAHFVTRGGERVAYYAAGPAQGRPLVLIHSINAAPSSYEVKPLFDQYRSQRPVYSLDLPGFGHSDRAPRRYSPDLFANAISDFLTQVVARPADVLALSLSAEFAARAALTVPGQITSLVLISPTGFSRRPVPSAGVGACRAPGAEYAAAEPGSLRAGRVPAEHPLVPQQVLHQCRPGRT